MRSLHRRALERPRRAILVAVLATAAAAPGLLRLDLRTDGGALVPPGAPEVETDRRIRREFGLEDPLVVLVEPRPPHPDGIFNPRTLGLIQDLTASVRQAAGIDSASVMSLDTETGDRFRPGSLAFRRFLDPLPTTSAELSELRSDLDALRLYTGTLVARDGGAAAILAGIAPGAERTRVVAAVEARVAAADTTGHAVTLIGAPVAETLLGLHILDDLRLLLPLAVLVMGTVFFLAFGSLTAALLPLAQIAACLVTVFGLMGWLGVPVYLTTAVLPVILTAVGMADEIHIFAAYARQRVARPEEPARAAVEAAMAEMAHPVTTTSVTTAAGFLAFALSPLPPVRSFGLFAAAGVLFCLIWSLAVIPALLVVLRPPGFRAPGWARTTALARALAGRPALTLGLAALAAAASPLGIRKLEVQDSWISAFAPESRFHRATTTFNREFLGAHLLHLVVDAGSLRLAGEIPAARVGHHELRIAARTAHSDLPDPFDPAALVGCRLAVRRRAGAAAGTGSPAAPGGPPLVWTSRIESAAWLAPGAEPGAKPGAGPEGGEIRLTTPRRHGSPRFLFQPAAAETLAFEIVSERFAEPRVLRRVAELEDRIRARSDWAVGGVLGPPDYVETTEFIVERRAAGARRIPDDPDRVHWLWEQYGQIRGAERLGELVDPERGRGVVTVFLNEANFKDTERLIAAIRDDERRELAPHGMHVEIGGDVAVSQAMIGRIVASQVRSLLGALAGVLALTAIRCRSLRWGAACLAPAAFSVAFTFAIMGWTGIPLGVATSMFAGMILGVGVDFSVHLVERYRRELGRGRGPRAALDAALGDTLPAILIDGAAVALGFGLLLVSEVPANARLGGMTVVCLAACLGATLLVIPALLRVASGARRLV